MFSFSTSIRFHPPRTPCERARVCWQKRLEIQALANKHLPFVHLFFFVWPGWYKVTGSSQTCNVTCAAAGLLCSTDSSLLSSPGKIKVAMSELGETCSTVEAVGCKNSCLNMYVFSGKEKGWPIFFPYDAPGSTERHQSRNLPKGGRWHHLQPCQ